MRFTTSTVALTVFSAAAVLGADYDKWSPAGTGDVRGPCPMLNTLANHGFLPHSGKGISVENVIEGMANINVESDVAINLFEAAKETNPNENATTFDLDHLSRHDILEHDGSLSRVDTFFGPADVFNADTFEETLSYWIGDTIDIKMAARARTARIVTSASSNPDFSLSARGSEFIYGETAGYLMVLGDFATATAPKAFVEFWFRNERLPVELGWSKPAKAIDTAALDDMSGRVFNATLEVMKEGGRFPKHNTTRVRKAKKGGMGRKRGFLFA